MANKNRKLQVFVSSTFIDLQEERQAAVQAILKVGHIPAGMELFKAGDAEQWEIIKTWIEESDVYMLILGGRYGSIESKSGKSYTQLEYEYALDLKKPFFAILINDAWTDSKAKKKGVKIEDFKEVYNLQKLNDFKATVKTKLVSFAEDLKDIKLAVSDSLHEINKRENLQGWVKADNTDLGKVSEELARLSSENSELQNQLAELNKVEKINGIEIDEFVKFLREKKIIDTIKLYVGSNELIIEFIEVNNLLSFFYFSHDYAYEEQFEDKFNGSSYIALNNYGLYLDSYGRRLSEFGSKLFVYLEMNKHLLEYKQYIDKV